MDDFKEMDICEKELRLHEELMASLDHFMAEHDLTYPQILGVLTIVQQSLVREFLDYDNEGEEPEGNDHD